MSLRYVPMRLSRRYQGPMDSCVCRTHPWICRTALHGERCYPIELLEALQMVEEMMLGRRHFLGAAIAPLLANELATQVSARPEFQSAATPGAIQQIDAGVL